MPSKDWKLDGVAPLVIDPPRGYSTTRQNQHICNHSLIVAITLLCVVGEGLLQTGLPYLVSKEDAKLPISSRLALVFSIKLSSFRNCLAWHRDRQHVAKWVQFWKTTCSSYLKIWKYWKLSNNIQKTIEVWIQEHCQLLWRPERLWRFI